MEASGPLVEEKGGFDKTFEGHVMRSVAIGASKKFSYACGQTPTLYYSMDEKQSTVYGLKFRDLQVSAVSSLVWMVVESKNAGIVQEFRFFCA